MSKLKEILSYICYNYPHKNELSKSRLTKMVYLADWKSAIDRGSSITNIEWKYDFYGPFVEEIFELVLNDQDFIVVISSNKYGDKKHIINLRVGVTPSIKELTKSDIEILDYVIEKTKTLFYNDFIQLVYSTYPIIKSEQFSTLNLIDIAEAYKKERSLFVAED